MYYLYRHLSFDIVNIDCDTALYYIDSRCACNISIVKLIFAKRIQTAFGIRHCNSAYCQLSINFIASAVYRNRIQVRISVHDSKRRFRQFIIQCNSCITL